MNTTKKPNSNSKKKKGVAVDRRADSSNRKWMRKERTLLYDKFWCRFFISLFLWAVSAWRRPTEKNFVWPWSPTMKMAKVRAQPFDLSNRQILVASKAFVAYSQTIVNSGSEEIENLASVVTIRCTQQHHFRFASVQDGECEFVSPLNVSI